jgi:hypothetical protein
MDPELVADIRHRAALGQNSPSGKRAPHARECRPVHLLAVVGLGMQQLQLVLPESAIFSACANASSLETVKSVACRIDRIGAIAVPSLIPYGLW